MSSSPVVRRACTGDLPEVLALAAQTAEAPHWPDAAYRDYLGETGSLLQSKALFVAIADERVRGFAALRVVADEAELESIAVDGHVRRSGIGTALLLATRAWAYSRGARGLLLEVRASNASAQAFYSALGFAPEGLRRGYYNEPVEDAALMRLHLRQEQNAEGLGGG